MAPKAQQRKRNAPVLTWSSDGNPKQRSTRPHFSRNPRLHRRRLRFGSGRARGTMDDGGRTKITTANTGYGPDNRRPTIVNTVRGHQNASGTDFALIVSCSTLATSDWRYWYIKKKKTKKTPSCSWWLQCCQWTRDFPTTDSCFVIYKRLPIR